MRRWSFAIVGIALVLRLAWLVYAKGSPPSNWLGDGDQFSYWYYGNELAAGRGYINYITHTATAYYPIGYPAILAVLFWIVDKLHLTNDQVLATGVMQVAASTATVALVIDVGRRVFTPRAGLVAGAILAVWPNVIFQVVSFQLETVYMFLIVASVAILVRHDWSTGLPGRGRLVAFGLVLGVSALVRPFSLWFLLGVLIAALLAGAGWKRAAVATLLPTAVIVVMFAPWTIRNAIAMDAFIPTSTNTGDTLCLDRNNDAQGGFRFSDHDGCADPALPEVPRNRENTRKAIDWVIHNPGRELVEIGRRAKLEFNGDHDGLYAAARLHGGPELYSSFYNLLSSTADWYFFAILILSIAGVPLLFVGPRPSERAIVAVATFSALGVPLLLWGNQRFHVPLLAFMAILAGALVDRLARFAYPRDDAGRTLATT